MENVKQERAPESVASKPQLTFGVLSLVAPLLALGVGFLISLLLSSGGGVADLAVVLLIGILIQAGTGLGLVFSIIAFVRKERWSVVRIIGLVLNLLPLLFLLVAIVGEML
jgi:hypothetical protein